MLFNASVIDAPKSDWSSTVVDEKTAFDMRFIGSASTGTPGIISIQSHPMAQSLPSSSQPQVV